jgi:hypothetical protein
MWIIVKYVFLCMKCVFSLWNKSLSCYHYNYKYDQSQLTIDSEMEVAIKCNRPVFPSSFWFTAPLLPKLYLEILLDT